MSPDSAAAHPGSSAIKGLYPQAFLWARRRPEARWTGDAASAPRPRPPSALRPGNGRRPTSEGTDAVTRLW